MQRKFILALLCVSLIAASAFVFYGCEKTEGNVGEPFYTFYDSRGREVKLYEKPQNVAVLLASYAEIWRLSGGKAAITVGDSVERGFAEADAVLVDDGAGQKIDNEKLLAAEPDFVIGSTDTPAQVSACETAEKAGIPCALFREDDFEDYLKILEIFCDINGEPDAYETYGKSQEATIRTVISDAERFTAENGRRSVLFIRAGSGGSATKAKTAENHFTGVMLKELCTDNIADEAKQLSETLSLEYILLEQPDVILITAQGDEQAAKNYITEVFSQAGWKDLKAVKEGNVYFLPKSMFNYKPNALWAEAYGYLYELLYGAGEYE